MTSDVGRAIVRDARKGDALSLARVYVETWRTTYAGMVPDNVLLGMSTNGQAARWSRVITGGQELVKLIENDEHGVVGLASGGPARDWIRGGGEVFTLYVHPDFQGFGYGRALLRSMFGAFRRRGWNAAILWVLAANPARFFYETVGGQRAGEREERLWGADLPEIAYVWNDLAGTLGDGLGDYRGR